MAMKQMDRPRFRLSLLTYDDFTAGLVRTKYSQNQVEAILANRGDGDKSHEAEFEAYQAWRIQAKQIAQEVLAREL